MGQGEWGSEGVNWGKESSLADVIEWMQEMESQVCSLSKQLSQAYVRIEMLENERKAKGGRKGEERGLKRGRGMEGRVYY